MSTFANNNDVVFWRARSTLHAPVRGLVETLKLRIDFDAECIFEPFEYDGVLYFKNGLQQVYKRTGYFLDYVGLYNLTTRKIDKSVE